MLECHQPVGNKFVDDAVHTLAGRGKEMNFGAFFQPVCFVVMPSQKGAHQMR